MSARGDWLLLGVGTVYAVRLGGEGFLTLARVRPTSDLYRTARELYGTAGELTFRVGEAAPYTGELFLGRVDVDGESLGHMTVEPRKVLHHDSVSPGPRYLLFGDDQLFLWHTSDAFEQGLRVRFSGWEAPVLGVDEVVPVTADGRLSPGRQLMVLGAELAVVAEVYLKVTRE
ncbi:hypothetical protein IAG44_27780 [Streptomyces roseirectus]|uniref:Uncharacterized protein n=1 Tax=Streptomyces roseirectus TaxID=2768066 RepID=A0A7H0IJ91_9ACTN|nr:hypothetical protein [Streptomyces roseirectus]QNP72857.1 hypothetical protein IAG44_27780 [Streptomyces roseirectus]